MPTSARATCLLGAAAIALGLAVAGPSLAEACGGMFRSPKIAPEKRPSLSREKVLLIHDIEQGRQHFIREVAFRRATEPFGFVVPTPARPEVEAVKRTPFTNLRDAFPFNPPVIEPHAADLHNARLGGVQPGGLRVHHHRGKREQWRAGRCRHRLGEQRAYVPQWPT